MDSLDPKEIVDGVRAASAMAKSARGLINELYPLVKGIPWLGIARVSARGFRKIAEAMMAAVRLPTPWPRASLAIKFSLTVIAYIGFLFCLTLSVADFDLLSKAHLTFKQSVLAALFLLFAAWGTAVTFAQAEWLRFLMAKNSRVLWGHRPTLKP